MKFINNFMDFNTAQLIEKNKEAEISQPLFSPMQRSPESRNVIILQLFLFLI